VDRCASRSNGSPSSPRGAFEIAQDTPVDSGAPAYYELALTALPPEGAVFDGVKAPGVDPELRWAQAALLVYEDRDDDHRLTIASRDGVSPDHVVGKAEGITVWFAMAGRPAPGAYLAALPVVPGLSVTRAPLVDPAPGDCTPGEPCMQRYADATLLPSPAPVDIAVTFDRHLDHYTCESFWGSDDWPDFASDWHRWSPLARSLCAPGVDCHCTGPACPLDVPPPGATVACAADGSAYVYKTCVEDPAVCGTRFCHYGHGERAPGAPPPAGWPCP
jgi:hypothetical protein